MAEATNQGRRSQTRRKLAPRSGVWVHFTRFKDDDGNDKARCKRCRRVLGATTRNGTSTLKAHVRICWGEEVAAAAAAAESRYQESDGSGSPSRETTDHQEENGSGDLARMIALRGYDASFVEDDYFRTFVRRLNPEFEVPSRVAIEEMCDAIFDEARRDLLLRLRGDLGRFSLAVGKAKTIEAGEVTYMACHFIDDQWNLHKPVLSAIVPEGRSLHYFEDGPGVRMCDAADYVINFISDYKVWVSMVSYDFTDDDVHPRLKKYIGGSCTTTTYVDNVLHSIARCLLPHADSTINMYEDMNDLNLTRQERLQLLSELGLDYEQAYDEHRYALYYSLQLLGKRGLTNKLAGVTVKLLCNVWEQAYRGIQRISASTSPTSNLCLAELLKLRETLRSELARVGDHSGNEYEEYLLRKAIDTMDKEIQGSYLIWSVPLALDPRYKYRYIEFSFKRAFGSDEATKYVSEVATTINKLYDDCINDYGTVTAADHSHNANETMAITSADPWEQAWNEHCRSQDVMATQVNKHSYPETQTELDRYLQDPVAPPTKDFDILKWWKDNSWNYPTVARMARDTLSMPTCSKPSSDQLAQVKSILRGYSKKSYRLG